MVWRMIWAALALLLVAPLSAQTTQDPPAEEPDAVTILARATEAMGGEQWANAQSLILTGHAEFWDASGAAPARRRHGVCWGRELCWRHGVHRRIIIASS